MIVIIAVLLMALLTYQIPLFLCQLGLVGSGQLLHPTVIDIGHRLHTLTAHALVTFDGIVSIGWIVIGQQHRTKDHRIFRFAVVVRINVQHDQPIGEFAGHIGIVPAALLGTEVHPMATRITGNAPHELIV